MEKIECYYCKIEKNENEIFELDKDSEHIKICDSCIEQELYLSE